jgi:hypothetical protein
MTYKVKDRKFFNADKSELVDAGSPEAAFLAFAPGDDLTDAQARKWGLADPDPEPDPASTPDPAPEPDKPPKSGARPANKMGHAPANKSSKDDEIL